MNVVNDPGSGMEAGIVLLIAGCNKHRTITDA
jgi:hypothetical protein